MDVLLYYIILLALDLVENWLGTTVVYCGTSCSQNSVMLAGELYQAVRWPSYWLLQLLDLLWFAIKKLSHVSIFLSPPFVQKYAFLKPVCHVISLEQHFNQIKFIYVSTLHRILWRPFWYSISYCLSDVTVPHNSRNIVSCAILLWLS
jgi:hypothetical protein